MKTPQVPALPGMTPLGVKPDPNQAAPLTGWRIGDAGFTVFGPKSETPGAAPLVLLTGKNKNVVRLAAASPDLKKELEILIGYAEAKHIPTPREIEMARTAITKAEIR